MTHAAIMRSLMAEWTGKRAEVRGRRRRAKPAAKPSQGCFFGYNRANSRTMIRAFGVSTNVRGRSQRL
jgi:hypothetical protein